MPPEYRPETENLRIRLKVSQDAHPYLLTQFQRSINNSKIQPDGINREQIDINGYKDTILSIKNEIDQMIREVEDYRFEQANQKGVKINEVYSMTFRPRTASTTSLFSGKELQFKPFPDLDVDVKKPAIERKINNVIRMPVRLKHSQSTLIIHNN